MSAAASTLLVGFILGIIIDQLHSPDWLFLWRIHIRLIQQLGEISEQL
jgi:hypothetical protein